MFPRHPPVPDPLAKAGITFSQPRLQSPGDGCPPFCHRFWRGRRLCLTRMPYICASPYPTRSSVPNAYFQPKRSMSSSMRTTGRPITAK